MTGGEDEQRIPVVVASGQVTERDGLVDVADLAERASVEALDQVPALRPGVDRVSVVNTLSPTGPALASALARRLGLTPSQVKTTVIGGNTPQALVTRAARDISRGRLGATLIAGAEAMRSVRAGHRDIPSDTDAEADKVHGTDRLGVGDAETQAGLFLPVHLYAMFESAIAASLGHTSDEHRAHLGKLLAPFAEVASRHPHAWFDDAPTADDIATPSSAMVAEPYTKRMAAFLSVDQAASLVVCSLGAARAAGVADRAVFVWSGASCNDVWEPVARPDLADSPGIAAAAGATLETAGLHIDAVDHLDLYSCFPAAVQAAAGALGVRLDDRRGLTVTGGLPYFGGPGNNYSTHAIATITDRIRRSGRGTGLVGALGWYTTKHAYGLYGASPPPDGFREADTTEDQVRIDAGALPVDLTLETEVTGTIAAATVVHQGDGGSAAPAFLDLDDGRRAAANAVDHQLDALAGTTLTGRRVRILPGTRRYEVLA